MISLFQISNNDQSMIYLGQIFGYMSASVLAPSSAPMLLGILFKVFNTTVLTVGAGIVIYTTIVGLMKTAAEGEFLGKQWSSLWVPLRTVFGIAAIFPLPSGYCAIQVVFMWIILQGIGAADAIWNAVINYSILGGNPTATQTAIGNIGLTGNMVTLFQDLVCQAESLRTDGDIRPTNTNLLVQFYCNHAGSSVSWCTAQPDTMISTVFQNNNNSATSFPMGPGSTSSATQAGGDCGTLTFCNQATSCTDTNSMSCKVCTAQRTVLQQIIAVMLPVATEVAQADVDYLNAKQSLKSAGSSDTSAVPGWLQTYCSDNQSGLGIPDCIRQAPAVYGVTGNQNDPTVTGDDAMKLVYWPYAIKSFVQDSTQSNDSAFMNSIINMYSKTLEAVVIQQVQNQVLNLASSQGEQWQRDAKDQGWIFAGGYFFKIISQKGKDLGASMPTLAVTGIPQNDPMLNYRNNTSAVGTLFSSIQAAANAAELAAYVMPGQFSQISSTLQNGADAILQGWQNNLTSNGSTSSNNPLISIGLFGYQLMVTAQVLFAFVLGATFLLVVTGTIDVMIMGYGLTLSPWGEAIKSTLGLVTPFFVALIMGLYSLGAILGIYVPLIPFMIFTMGALGWMLATVEAMVAAPIVALGILSPGGQSEILGRGEASIWLMLNLFLRPGLMIVGLMAASLVSVPAIQLVNTAFMAATNTIITNPGLFEEMLFVMVYSSFIVTVISKCYSLTYVIPERVLTWIGGQAVQYGEGEALQASKQVLEGGAGAIGGAGKQSVEGGVGAGIAVQRAREKQKAGEAGVESGKNADVPKEGPKNKDGSGP